MNDQSRLSLSLRLVPFALLAVSPFSLSQAQATSPQAVIYIGQSWCGGGYCGSGPSATFQSSLEQALVTSGVVQAVRKEPAEGLELRGGITSIGGGGGICLPFVGCLNAKTVRGSIELTEKSNGAIFWRDNCEGSANGFSGWSNWTGYITVNSDEDKAAADCAGKLVQKFLVSPAFIGYLTRVKTAPLAASAPVQGQAGSSVGGSGGGGSATPAPVVNTVSASWVYPLFFPSEALRAQACADGYASASKGVSATPPGIAQFNSTEGTITATTSYNTIFLSCQDAGSKLKPKPDSVPQLDFVISIKHNSYVEDEKISAALAFYNESDIETGRITLYTAGRTPGDNQQACRRYSTTICTINLTPDRLDASERAAINSSSYAKLLINLGKGAESFTLNKARFPSLK